MLYDFRVKSYNGMNLTKTLLSIITILFLFACSNQKEYLPESIYNLFFEQKLIGEEAENFVNKLHIQNVTDEENLIGFYEGEKGRALIYLTFYDKDADAENNYRKMTEKISPQNSVFIGGEYLTIDNTEIYRCFGMGQTHYVFYNNSILVWLSVETVWAEDFLKEYMAYLSKS